MKRQLIKSIFKAVIVVCMSLSFILVWHLTVSPIFTGSVAINSQPSGAKVSIDNSETCVTPCAAERISFGKHSIKVAKDDFLASIETRNVPLFGNITLDFKLQEPLAYISIATTPPGADVYVDSKKAGQTPLENVPVSVGKKAELKLQKEGFQEIKKDINIGVGSKENLSYALIPWKVVAIEDGNVVLLNADGSGKQKLVDNGLGGSAAYYFPEKQQVIYTQKESNTQAELEYLYSVTLDGKLSTKILSEPVFNAQKVPSKNMVAFSSPTVSEPGLLGGVNTSGNLKMLDLDPNAKPVEITAPKDASSLFVQYIFSPNGQKVAIEKVNKLDLYDYASKKTKKLLGYPSVSRGEGYDLPDIIWSKDSQKIYLNPTLDISLATEADKKTYTKDYQDKYTNFYKIDVNTSKTDKLATFPANIFTAGSPFAVSPDEKNLLLRTLRKDKRGNLSSINAADFVYVLYTLDGKNEEVVLPEISGSEFAYKIVWQGNDAYILTDNKNGVSVYQYSLDRKTSRKVVDLPNANPQAGIIPSPFGGKLYLSYIDNVYDDMSKTQKPAGRVYTIDQTGDYIKLLDNLSSIADIKF